MYFLLDIKRRYQIDMKFQHDLDLNINTHLDEVQKKFELKWSKHSCDTVGCPTVMVRFYLQTHLYYRLSIIIFYSRPWMDATMDQLIY